jgi:hypothetical protein
MTDMTEQQAEQLLESGISQIKNEPEKAEPVIEAKEETQENPEPEKEEKEGSKFVKTDDPAADARIRYLARQVKASDERNQQQNILIQKLNERLEQIESSQHKSAGTEALNIIKQQLKEAKEIGDIDKEIELTDRLTDLKAELKTIPTQKQEAKQEQSIFSPADIAFVNELIPSRPYLQKGHPQFEKALNTAAKIAKVYDDRGEYADIVTIMEDLHREMTPRKPSHAEVLPGRDLTTKQTNVKIRLDETQKAIAKKLGIGEDSFRNAVKNKSTRVSIEDL